MHLSSIHHSDEFITKRHFDELADNIYYAISLQAQYRDGGPSKQATVQALGKKLAV